MRFIITSCIFAILIINVKCICRESDITPYINFMYFNGDTLDNYTTFNYSTAISILEEPTIDLTLPVVFYFHGWSENPLLLIPSQSPVIVLPSLLKQKVNTIAVSYGPLVQKWSNETLVWPLNMAVSYGLSVANATCMIEPLQIFFDEFLNQCNCSNNTQFIGFSIGAQVAGLVSRGLEEKVSRIDGLDPAGPLYEFQPHLKSTDASFVNVIHTNPGGFGFPLPCGKADFWPNYGMKAQTNCSLLDLRCNHYASTHYFANSISNPSMYEVKRCYLPGICEDVNYMGFWTTIQAHGNYFLQI